MHAGQSSARKRREAIKRREDQEFASAIDDMIWDQVVRQGDETPAWIRPTLLVLGAIASLAWLGALAHGCL